MGWSGQVVEEFKLWSGRGKAKGGGGDGGWAVVKAWATPGNPASILYNYLFFLSGLHG